MAESAFAKDFFISRSGPVAETAREVAQILEAEGYSTIVQDYDASHGETFTAFIHRALIAARHLIVLHTHDYDTSHWTEQEFTQFLAAPDRAENKRRICVLRCDDAAPRGLLAGIVYGDLHNVADPERRKRIVLNVALGRPPEDRVPRGLFGGPAMPLENPLFTGRTDLLTALHEALGQGATALTQIPTTVHGMGGVGKTALARAFIAKYTADYAHVWWIGAENRDKIVAGLDALAREMHPDLPPDSQPTDNAARALRDVAERGGFLLVYDNAESPDDLRPFLPRKGAAVLITSRAPVWDSLATTLRVDTMQPDEATAFLQVRASRPNPDDARALAKALGYLPLALDHAGAYIAQTGIGYVDYRRRLTAMLSKHLPGMESDWSVAATFALAIDRVPSAEPVLGLFAWLDPEAIPRSLAATAEPDEDRLDDAIVALTNAALIARGPDTACGPSVTMHRLVQTIVRERLATAGKAEAARDAALAALAAAFPYAFKEPTLWPTCRALIPHVRVIDAHLGDTPSADLGRLLDRAGGFLHGSGAARDGAELLRRALDSCERALGPEHPDTLRSRNNLAACLDAMGDLAGAKPLYRRTLEAYERILGPEHPYTLGSRNNLAGCLLEMGDLAAAEPLYRRTLEARERVLGPEHPDTLGSRNNLAVCLKAMGDLGGGGTAVSPHIGGLRARAGARASGHARQPEQPRGMPQCDGRPRGGGNAVSAGSGEGRAGARGGSPDDGGHSEELGGGGATPEGRITVSSSRQGRDGCGSSRRKPLLNRLK